MSAHRRPARIIPIHNGTQGVHDLHTAFPQSARWNSPRKLGLAALLLLTLIVGGIVVWRGGWNSLPITDKQISSGLVSDDPQELQRSLVAIGERMRLHRPAAHWYHEVIRLSSDGDQSVRARAAWVMGLDPKNAEFHRSLLPLLNDPERDVRGVAGIALAEFVDRAGHAQIVEMLRPLTISAAHSGDVSDTRRRHVLAVGDPILTLRSGDSNWKAPSPIAGILGKMLVHNGDTVSAGVPIAVLYPSQEHAWGALHALELLGDTADLEVVRIYMGDVPWMPQDVVDEASAAERAIRQREKNPK